VNVNRPTALAYTGDTTQDYHDSTTLSARLTDAISGTAIGGETVTFTLGSQGCSARRTDPVMRRAASC